MVPQRPWRQVRAGPKGLAHGGRGLERGRMQTSVLQTSLGPIPLRAPPGALASERPMVLAITGAWAEPEDMIKLPAVVAPAWDAAVMRLPGNGTPDLAETSVAAWARAVGELVEAAFPGRP